MLERRRVVRGPHVSAVDRPFLGAATDAELASADELAAALCADLADDRPLGSCDLLPLSRVLWLAMTAPDPVTPAKALLLASSSLEHQTRAGKYKASSIHKFAGHAGRFVRFVDRAFDLTDIRQVDSGHVRRFVSAPTTNRSGAVVGEPTTSTSYSRWWAVDLLFRELITLGVVTSNPAAGMGFSHSPGTSARPLTDEEELVARRHAARNLRDTRGPAAWALGRATAYSTELGLVTVRDVDLELGVVWLTGAGAVRAARWGLLDEWGVERIHQRIKALRLGPDDYVVYEGGGNLQSIQSSSCMVISEAFRRAGIADHDRVRPASLALWAGRKVFDRTGDIEEVRCCLGLSSLDDARRVIEAPLGRSDVPPLHRRESV